MTDGNFSALLGALYAVGVDFVKLKKKKKCMMLQEKAKTSLPYR